MTNTLHRKGSAEDLQKDFVIFALPKLGMLPVKEVIGTLKRFSEICVRHDPLNMGKVDKMALRRIDPTRLRAEMEDNIGLTATFDNIEAVASVVAELKQADLQELSVESVQRGNSERGKAIFHREKLGCVKCHVASPASIEQGLRAIGPDQRNVGDRL
ncbi:MAG: hypothetical protein HOE30_07915, partial [Deltaproteobacteria bacterium]|nr:hypothetical protein [Deltaproteobacteria bacterium]